MAQNYKVSDVLQAVANSQIRVALERLMKIAGLGINDRVDDPIVKDITGDTTGDVTGDVTGNVTGNLTGDVTGDVTGVITASQSNGNPTMLVQNSSLGSGGMAIYQKTQFADITALASVSIAVSIPSGAKILGCQLIVQSALTAGETWDAAYETGSVQAIASAQAVAVNTKVNKVFDVNTDTDIASAATTIAITKNGGGAFTAAGQIRAVVYYMDFEDIDDV